MTHSGRSVAPLEPEVVRMSENRTRGIQFGAPRAEVVTGGTGVEPPVPEWVDVSQTLERWFAFIDVSGFTTFTERNGTPAALEVLTRFRSAVRAVTGRRGVRVLKWLGDGAMLVGVAPGPVVAAVCELRLRFDEDAFDIHAGIAGGHVLLFEGDDYIGPAANHASRLCEAALPGEVLAVGVGLHLPEWVLVNERVSVHAPGDRRAGRRHEAGRRRVGVRPSRLQLNRSCPTGRLSRRCPSAQFGGRRSGPGRGRRYREAMVMTRRRPGVPAEVRRSWIAVGVFVALHPVRLGGPHPQRRDRPGAAGVGSRSVRCCWR